MEKKPGNEESPDVNSQAFRFNKKKTGRRKIHYK
jgi:hypothetical protein